MSEKIFDPCLACDVCKDDCTYQLKQEENKKLKAQLEKMKNCENCKHRTVKFIAVACRITDSTDMPDYVCDKWEMMK